MAVSTKVDICNLSLDLLSGGVITSIDSPTTATELLYARWYDQVRKNILREHPWKFATKRTILSAAVATPAFGYSTSFALPSDFIRLLTIESDEGLQILSDEYQIESISGVQSILMSTDATTVNLRYIYDIEDVTEFDATFISYFALSLALATAYKVTESNGNVERITALQKQQGAMARAISGQERQPTRIERSKNRAARRGGAERDTHRIVF